MTTTRHVECPDGRLPIFTLWSAPDAEGFIRRSCAWCGAIETRATATEETS